MSAERMCMPSPTIEQFIDAVKKTVLANQRWVLNLRLDTLPEINFLFMPKNLCSKNLGIYIQVPPHGRGALYIRPLLMGIGPNLGVKPASEYKFLAYASPVGNYHKVCCCQIIHQKSKTSMGIFFIILLLFLLYAKMKRNRRVWC